MLKLVDQQGELIADQWRHAVAAQVNLSDGGHYILCADDFAAQASTDKPLDFSKLAISLTSDSDVASLSPYIDKLTLIVLDFPAFMDGRLFSTARILREQMDYTGELRATGQFIQDQMCYLRRCGVNTFELSTEADLTSIAKRLSEFSESYQAAADEAQPLFRRRL